MSTNVLFKKMQYANFVHLYLQIYYVNMLLPSKLTVHTLFCAILTVIMSFCVIIAVFPSADASGTNDKKLILINWKKNGLWKSKEKLIHLDCINKITEHIDSVNHYIVT